ncbi:MAG: DUF1788 domain-containing protein [Clostridia bacterium]|nr:DUF1788 domain-containing protein [Clostridia bacterium]
MSNINERLDRVRSLIQEKDFLEGKGLSNEVNIHIFCYDAKDEMKVRHFVDQIKADWTLTCHLIECNLYKTFLSICDDKRITKSIPRMEKRKGKEYLLTQMHSIATEAAFVEKMQYEPHELGDVLMLTSVGEVFPFMRIHSLLEALQPHFSDIPILVLYPGVFDGRRVKLFNKLQPNDYYRAFNVV